MKPDPNEEVENLTDEMRTMDYSVDSVFSEIGFGKYQILLFFLTGFAFFCAGYQIMCYSALLPYFIAKWGISYFSQCYIISAEHLGYTLGSLFVTLYGEKYGRKKPLILGSIVWCVFAVFSMMTENLFCYIFFRFAIGFLDKFVLLYIYTILTEYLPTKYRGKLTNLLDAFYGLGNITAVLVGYLFIDFNWRIIIFTSIIINFLFVLYLILFVDESVRYEIMIGDFQSAMNIIEKISRMNKFTSDQPYFTSHKQEKFVNVCRQTQQLILEKYTQKKSFFSSISKIFSGKFRFITITLSIFWLGNIISYFGVLNLLPVILSRLGTNENSLAALIGPLSLQIPSCFVASSIVDMKGIGRRNPLIFSSVIIGIASFLIYVKIWPGLFFYLSIMIFFHSINFMIKWIYTAELYPTPIRMQGLGFCNFLGRSSGIIMPFIGLSFLEIDYFFPFLFFGASTMIGGLALLALKYETNEMELDAMMLSEETSPA